MFVIIIIAISAIVFGCDRKINNPQNTEYDDHTNHPDDSTTVQININIDKINRNFWYDSIFSEYQYIPLETNDNSLIGEISKIIQYDSLLFVGDFVKTKSIFLFNIDGRFITKISNIGKGPMEYTRLADFSINKRDRLIEILAADNEKIIKFDFTGKPISEHELGFLSSAFVYTDDGYFLYANGKKEKHDEFSYKLKRINNEFQLEYNYLKYRFSSMKHRNSKLCYFSTYNNKELICPMFSNYIYELRSDNLVPRYHFNFGKNTLSQSETYNKTNKELRNYLIENKKISIHTYAETTKYLFLTLLKGDKFIRYIYNKQDPEKSQLASVIGRKQQPCYSFSKLYKGDGDNSIISVIEPVNFIKCKNVFESKGIEVNDTIGKISEMDNPIIVIAKE